MPSIGLSDLGHLAGNFSAFFSQCRKFIWRLKNSVSLRVEYWLVRSLPSCRKPSNIFGAHREEDLQQQSIDSVPHIT